ncbi:metalloregulator ArsR/SmtB family transcription factor [Thiohalobacter sp. IOR34]|uniref:metalloregulator ArsR/SmtB family transcription factor n=1 Tax=Thiohalobacter sp. IOR34 TaxID=3057176 RepID=UPI0025B1C8E3|nr:metalloregulator ArsR/SmtB family transcription factor [Thiohalobacter sp. IOR34]WJW74295.1 metalloregulator ArsR/SmtB family transcription factor [Thiohalobacter sp. IOR34]
MDLDAPSFFRLLGDATRLRALLLLQQEGELCVCELTHALGQSQPKISRHLAQLRDAGVALPRRAGQWMYYRINPDLPAWAQACLAATAEQLAGEAPYAGDRKALRTMPNRPGSACCA